MSLTAVEAVSLVAEVLSWVTLPLGLVILVSGYLRSAMSPEWQHSPAVVMDVPRSEIPVAAESVHELEDAEPEHEHGSVRVLRWFAGDGSVRQTVLDPDLSTDLDLDDELFVYFDPAKPEMARLSRPPRTGKHLVRVGWTLAILGIACFALTFVILFAS